VQRHAAADEDDEDGATAMSGVLSMSTPKVITGPPARRHAAPIPASVAASVAEMVSPATVAMIEGTM
jgi:hypothetical protein